MVSLINGLSVAGGGIAAFAGSAGLEAQKAQLAQDSMRLADSLATTRETALQSSAGDIAAKAQQTQNTFQTGIQATHLAAIASEGALTRQAEADRQQAALNAPTPEIKSAKQFATLSPAERQAYREEMMTKAGLPAWMIGGGDNPPPPTGSGAITPDAGSAASPAPTTTGTDGNASRNDSALQNVPGAAASLVKGMVDGRIAPPSSFALSKPYWQGLISKAAEYDPTFDQTTWAGRVATRKDFAAGKSAQAVTALNTALGHAGDLMGNFEKLGNFGGVGTPLNAPLNWIEQKMGDSRQTVVEQNINALASEARKVFAASGGGNLTELQEWQKSFPLNGSPEQQRGALTGFVNLLDSRLQSLADQYNRGMGRTDDPINLLQPKARAVYEKLTGHEPLDATGYQTGKAPPSTAKVDAAPVIAPVDPAAREPGKSYPLPNGKTGIWRGTGWELAP